MLITASPNLWTINCPWQGRGECWKRNDNISKTIHYSLLVSIEFECRMRSIEWLCWRWPWVISNSLKPLQSLHFALPYASILLVFYVLAIWLQNDILGNWGASCLLHRLLKTLVAAGAGYTSTDRPTRKRKKRVFTNCHGRVATRLMATLSSYLWLHNNTVVV